MTDDMTDASTDAVEPSAPSTGDLPALRTTEPAVMRALAHPLRIEILDVLDQLSEATASELAQRLGQSVANCSFHLRILAAGGLIVRGEPRGREKPWKVAHHSRNMRPDYDDPSSVAESAALGSLYVQREAARVIKFLSEAPALNATPAGMRAVTINSSTFWATVEEMEELSQDIVALMDRFEGRRDPANRPEGARQGRLFATVNPEITDEDRQRAEVADDDGAGG